MNPESQFSCVVVGAESLLIQCAEILLERGHAIRGVVSDDPSIVAWAESRDLVRIDPGSGLAERLAPLEFDYLFSIANLSMLPDGVIQLAGRASINFHDGPLPRYAGLNAPTWAVIAGEPTHGVTWHYMTKGADEGDLLVQRIFELGPEETSLTVNAKCYEAGIESFAELVTQLATGNTQPVAQDFSQRTVFTRDQRPRGASALNPAEPADVLARLVRGLDFGPYRNLLGRAKLLGPDWALTVATAEYTTDAAIAAAETTAGKIESVVGDSLEFGTGEGQLRVGGLATLSGQSLTAADLGTRFGLVAGGALPPVDADTLDALSHIDELSARDERFWCRRLERLTGVEIPEAGSAGALPGPDGVDHADCELPVLAHGDQNPADIALAACAAYLSRVCELPVFSVAFSDAALDARVAGFEHVFSSCVPLRVALERNHGFRSAVETLGAELERVRRRVPFARDLVAREPALAARSELAAGSIGRVGVLTVDALEEARLVEGTELTLAVSGDGRHARWIYDTHQLDRQTIDTLLGQFETFVTGIYDNGLRPISEISLLDPDQRRKLLVDWNATEKPFPADRCVHELFEEQVARTPDRTAVHFRGESLTYRQLDTRANRLAHHLRSLGVGPDVPVGVLVDRSIDMFVATLATLKAGGAYLPLDPTYPQDRIAFMIQDANVGVLLTQQRLETELPPHRAQVVCVDGALPEAPEDRPASDVTSANLAYVIYTSGSTGTPKGVMVEHRNVANFFAGMDDHVRHDPPGVWLAVTSLSFDISVLELFWTLARGFEVVLYADENRAQTDTPRTHARRAIDFSLCYWGVAGADGEDAYHLLLEGAKFADRNGFKAVWTPERHFHAFGGIYPNPSVISAALATVTDRIELRAGSCVLPLHHPARVAEEWSVVDNLSHGRVGVAIASGWMPNDFVLKPESYEGSKDVMFRNLEVVRRLWRGDAVSFPGPKGDTEIRTLPRPIQPELPVWVTTAGSPDTYRMAAEAGANVLTHLLGQTVEEVAEKIELYRKTWAQCGHPGRGQVTLMLHTFVGDDADTVREVVRGPLKEYLRSSVSLVKSLASTFPIFKGISDASEIDELFDSLEPEDVEAVLDHSFDRYFETSGLFGTPEMCLDMVDRIKGADVDEIACLIDYGIATDQVLEHLVELNEVRTGATAVEDTQVTRDDSIASLIDRHEVTHLQCTPSMASMLCMDDAARIALGHVGTLLVGGEAFPTGLASELDAIGVPEVLNMYGPTETTIWSAVQPVSGALDPVPIGRPIANTELYVVDANLEPVPVGAAGELLIGGAGVVRGYLGRTELTAERFVSHPFSNQPNARLYRTGDLVRYREDGVLEFLGRIDHQVKLRGHRIELGEIESVLTQHADVRECVVIAREDQPGDKRLVAYSLRAAEAGALEEAELREHVRSQLPEYMIPSHFVELERFPQTPNKKIDRKALPAPDAVETRSTAELVPPQNELEIQIAEVWSGVLGIANVGTRDNFFDLGGHSLLVVQVQRDLKLALERPIPLTDLFRFPTIASLAEHLGQGPNQATVAERSEDRAGRRRDALAKRRKLRRGPSTRNE